jgi:membrane associated rhomboid family serine protease
VIRRHGAWKLAFGPASTGSAVRGLLIANGVLFVLQLLVGWQVIAALGLVPSLVLRQFSLWRLFTYMFLHGGLIHLAFNMFVLWMFGSEIERFWGRERFLFYYILTGLGAGICAVLLEPNSLRPVIGASGAVFGLLVAFALMFPSRVVYVFMVFPMRAKYFVILLGVLELVLSLDRGGGVAHFAHLGGLITGYVFLRHRHLGQAAKAALARRRERKRTEASVTREQKLVDLRGEVDRILDKITREGIDTLTPKEKRILEKASILFRQGPSSEDSDEP